MTKTVRMPVGIAATRGVSRLTSESADQRIVLTNHGKPVAIVDSAERIDEDLRLVREAALTVIDAATHLVWERSEKLDLDQVCERLGIDAHTVRSRRRTN